MVLKPDKVKQLEDYQQDLLDTMQAVGFTVTLIEDSEIEYEAVVGRLSIHDDEPVDRETLFGVGSISKTFTTLLLLLLHERGLLSIEDPIAMHLPLKLSGKEQEIKLKHLMSHSSGLPNLYICIILEHQLGIRPDYQQLQFQQTLHSWQDIFAYVERHADYITTKPGERFHYSDLAFSLLQYIIEQVTGTSYADALANYIFQPLGMTSACTRSEYTDQKAASGHFHHLQTQDTTLQAVMPNYPPNHLVDGGGGVMASTNDMQTYLQMVMQGGIHDNKAFLSSELYDLWITPIVDIDTDRGISYALGWIHIDMGHATFIFHTGNTGAFTSSLGFFKGMGIGIFHSNNVNIEVGPFTFNLMNIWKPGLFVLPAPKGFQYSLRDFVGTYHSPNGLEQLKLVEEGGDLLLQQMAASVYKVETTTSVLYPEHDEGGCLVSGAYYTIKSGSKVPVRMERTTEAYWITVGISKYKKIPTS